MQIDALPDMTKAATDGLIVECDVFWSRAQFGFTEFPGEESAQYKPRDLRCATTLDTASTLSEVA